MKNHEAIIRDLRNPNLLYEEIAKRNNCNVATVCAVVRSTGIRRRRGRKTLTVPTDRHLAILAYGKKHTLQETGDKFGCTKERVRQLFKQWGRVRENRRCLPRPKNVVATGGETI